MNIRPLSVQNRAINFGYDAQYHEKVRSKLSKRKDPRARFMLQSDKQLLELEDEIVELEREKKTKTQKYKDLTDMLLELKPTIAYFIELLDGSLEYFDNLIKNYLKEMENTQDEKAYSWRKDLCKKLNVFALYDYFAGEKAQKEKKEIASEETTKETGSDAATDAANTPKTSSYITLYTPNEYSPKNLQDVVGSEDIKEKLMDDLIYYIQSPELSKQDYVEYGIRAPRGFLFYGPPGCGKTYITQALANEMGMDMYMMDVSKVGSMFVNKTSNNIQDAFEFLYKRARESQKPIILFMDEVDALAKDRDDSTTRGSMENSKTTTTLLKLVESARDKNIIVICATNKYDLLDNAFKDRFDEQIYFPLPDKEQIKNLVTFSLLHRKKGEMLGNDKESIDKLVDLLKGYSNRSIVFILDEAAKSARKRSRDNITFEDIKSAIETSELEKHNEKDYMKLSKRKAVIGF